jgi:probable rRNA maturation factor
VTVDVQVENRSGWAVDEPAAVAAVRAALAEEGVTEGELGLALVDPLEMTRLNADHRGKDAPTDVLSFPMDGLDPLPAGVPRQLGDLVVCPQVAAGAGTPVALLLVHGALHLVGYDHETDGGRMLARQAELMREVSAVAASPA